MNYAKYEPVDVMNGPGTRAVLWVSGCAHSCRGCYNEAAKDRDYGHPFNMEMQDRIISDLKDTRIRRRGLSLTGGDPFMPANAVHLIPFLERVRRECPDKDIWSWTGYRLRELKQSGLQWDLLNLVDVLVDGPFVQKLYDPGLRWRGSSNQIVHVLTE